MAKLLTDRYKLPIKADESDNFFGYLKALFFFERNERLAVLPMNGSGAVIGAYFVSEGNRKSVSACFDNILEYIFKGCKQGKFILAHNHPENLSEPSAEDISSTAYIQNRALECGGELTAHYIVGTDGVSKVPMECSYIEYLFNKQNLEK
jgi:DNA repair protein RadC